MAFDPAGNTDVADFGNHRIQTFSPAREFITAWGSVGTDDGELLNPSGVAVEAQGTVLVSDGANRIQIFAPGQVLSPAPMFLASWGSFGEGSCGSHGVAVDDGGRVYASAVGQGVHAFQLLPPFAP